MSDKLNLFDTIKKQDKFSTFTRLMESSGTNDVISSGAFTAFVPTNEAFSRIPESKINELLNETGQTKLKALLSYHILPGKVMAANLGSAPSRKALSGEELMFTDINGLKVNGASIKERNLEATNGVIHVLDAVLIPTRIPMTAPSMTPMGAVTLSPVPSAPAATKTTLGSPGISGVQATASATPNTRKSLL